jgi:hypothetical protein
MSTLRLTAREVHHTSASLGRDFTHVAAFLQLSRSYIAVSMRSAQFLVALLQDFCKKVHATAQMLAATHGTVK